MYMRGGTRKDSIGEVLVPIADAMSKGVFGASLRASVAAGEVTVLLYTPRDGGGATLERVEIRPA
jgi:hypothetical protein